MTTQSLREVHRARPAKTEPQFPQRTHEPNAPSYEADPLEVHFGRSLPVQLIRRYARLAARRADTERLEDGTWFASIQGFPGVWAQGESEEEVLKEIESVVRDWTCFKIVDKDRDLPVIDTIDLNVL